MRLSNSLTFEDIVCKFESDVVDTSDYRLRICVFDMQSYDIPTMLCSCAFIFTVSTILYRSQYLTVHTHIIAYRIAYTISNFSILEIFVISNLALRFNYFVHLQKAKIRLSSFKLTLICFFIINFIIFNSINDVIYTFSKQIDTMRERETVFDEGFQLIVLLHMRLFNRKLFVNSIFDFVLVFFMFGHIDFKSFYSF